MGSSQSFQQPSQYSVPVAGTGSASSSMTFRSPNVDPEKGLVTCPQEGIHTLYDNFLQGVKRSGPRPCLGYRPVTEDGKALAFEWQTYDEVFARAKHFGSGVKHLGLVNTNADGYNIVVHFMRNCPEWVISEQAANAFSNILVPLYDTLTPDAVAFVVNQTEASVVVCAPMNVKALLAVKPNAPSMKTVVVTGTGATAEQKAAAKEAGLELLRFEDVEAAGREHPQELVLPKPEDVATICYTSGTTGDPKGAMLTHRNIVADVGGALVVGLDVLPEDVHLSYLPLAHMFERIVEAACWNAGARVGFYQGDPKLIMEDIKALRPTIFPSVPRLYNRIYDKITQGAAAGGGLKASMFEKALASKLYYLKEGENTHTLWDALVFSKIKARVGLDRVRIMITGSAPLADHVMDFLRAVFGVRMQEGYGQTENSAAATITFPNDYSVGHVGGPLACCEMKLESVPEMGYLITDTNHGAEDGKEGIACQGRGEVCLRGHNVFLGYYKLPEKTAEALDADGWLHTGDVGIILPNGALKIVDRKKNIFKLSQGEYIAAEKIENIYTRSPFVAQMFVYGDSLQSCVVGIAVPDEEYLVAWAARENVQGTYAQLCANEDVKKVIWDDLKKQEVEGKLCGFEKVRGLHIEAEPWSVDNDLLTPTFKLKRPVAKKHYREVIDAMYASGIGVVAGKTGLKQG